MGFRANNPGSLLYIRGNVKPWHQGLFMPLIIKCWGHHVMAYVSVASMSVNIWFLSIIGQTLGQLIRFYCGLLGVSRGRFLSMISSAAHPRWSLRPPSWIWFPSITGQTPGSVDLIFMWLIGVTRARFLSMISSATHPRWPTSWISFPSIRGQTPGLIDPICLWLIGGDYRARFLLMISSTTHPRWPPYINSDAIDPESLTN
jgi:hypothetical protein